MEKTKEIAMNSTQSVYFMDGVKVPRVDKLKYLGTLITHNTDLGPEISNRIGQSEQTFRKLKTLWRDPA
eukprot:8621922-Alexandrium_andersonii.AAC.1